MGKRFGVKQVVIAAGIGPFKKKPEVFQNLSPQQAIHCYEGRGVRKFAGKRVAVIGAGQSALESAALLHEAKAQVEVIARQPHLRWIGQHPWLHHMGPISSMLYSSHDIGPLGISRLVAYPKLVSYVPLKLRDRIRTRAVRPAGSRWLPARLAAVKITTSCGVSASHYIWRRGCPQTGRRQRASRRPCHSRNRVPGGHIKVRVSTAGTYAGDRAT